MSAIVWHLKIKYKQTFLIVRFMRNKYRTLMVILLKLIIIVKYFIINLYTYIYAKMVEKIF